MYQNIYVTQYAPEAREAASGRRSSSPRGANPGLSLKDKVPDFGIKAQRFRV